MAYFLAREEPKFIDPREAACTAGSPLARLVQDGYSGKKGGDAAHQQENAPPMFGQTKSKTEGRRHLQSANGQNAFSLAWDDGAGEHAARRGGGAAPKNKCKSSDGLVTAMNKCKSSDGLVTAPPTQIASGIGHTPLREADDMPIGSGDAAYAKPPPVGRMPHGNRNVAPPPNSMKPPETAATKLPPRKAPESMEAYGIATSGRAHGAVSQQEAYAVAANRQRGAGNSGGHVGSGPSYGGASGNGGQNTGNMLGNRNSSRVLAPPGGFSSFQLG